MPVNGNNSQLSKEKRLSLFDGSVAKFKRLSANGALKASGFFNAREGFVLLDIPEGQSVDKQNLPTNEEMSGVDYSVRPVFPYEDGLSLARKHIENS